MKSIEIRQRFLDFFKSKNHLYVPSTSLINNNDPSLMFINSGMVQFKDYFLENKVPPSSRITNFQKCLRISGKHNDLDDVGIDGTHHTMFEMLGNWSFNDYTKHDAISWAWELLTDVYKIDKDRLFVTVFEGDFDNNILPDTESFNIWSKYLPKNHIVYGNVKDNFWSMGDTGLCGSCTEIHIDLRSDDDRTKLGGEKLVNKDHPELIEIWNIVTMEYDRKSNGELEKLDHQHIDTGMGLERIAMVLQNVKNTYDTDLFTPLIQFIEDETNIKYTNSYDKNSMIDISFRVLVDHIRSIVLMISDNLLPSSNNEGYVLRRLLRRSVRYYYSFLNMSEPFLYRMVSTVCDIFGEIYPNIVIQKDFISSVIKSEELNFLNTIKDGINKLDKVSKNKDIIDGKTVFELHDTYGFPYELTQQILSERGISINTKELMYEINMRKRTSTKKITVSDWVIVNKTNKLTGFIGYDSQLNINTQVIKYRKVELNNNYKYQLVFEQTPFYPESGGQVGDTGYLINCVGNRINIIDTQKVNDLIVHITNTLPSHLDGGMTVSVDYDRRSLIECNSTATHLLHDALRKTLHNHVRKINSYVDDKKMWFDFTYFVSLTDEQLNHIESTINDKIQQHINVYIQTNSDRGDDINRLVKIGNGDNFSSELCDGCHVDNTRDIGMFKIIKQSYVSTGVIRIEAVTSNGAYNYVNDQLNLLNKIKSILNQPQDVISTVNKLQKQVKSLKSDVEKLSNSNVNLMYEKLCLSIEQIGDINYIGCLLDGDDVKTSKALIHKLSNQFENLVLIFGFKGHYTANLMIYVSENLIQKFDLRADKLINDVSTHIDGKGGGQPFLAVSGGKNPSGINNAITYFKKLVSDKVQ